MPNVKYYGQKIEIFKGEDVTLEFNIDNAPIGGIGSWTLAFSIERKAGDTSTAILSKTTSSGISINGTVITVILSSSDTDTLSVKTYDWDLKRTNTGAEKVIASGKLIVFGNVSP